MGDIVDLDAFRKQREDEEKAKAEEEERIKAEEEQAEIEYLTSLVHNIMAGLGSLLTGASPSGYNEDPEFRPYYPSDYRSNDFELSTYYHEAGYDDDGYYEKNWQYDPWGDTSDDEEGIGDDDEQDI